MPKDYQIEPRQLIIDEASIEASGSRISPPINLHCCRTITVTCRVTYHGSATKGVTVGVHISPDGKNVDTIAYTSFVPTLAAGQAVQRTVIIDPPEQGYLQFKVTNDDTSRAVTGVKVWYTIHRWSE